MLVHVAVLPVCSGNVPLDNLSLTDGEAQWLTPLVAGIEFGAIRLQCAFVVHGDLVTTLALSVTFDGAGYFDFDLGSEDAGGYCGQGGESEETHCITGRWWVICCGM